MNLLVQLANELQIPIISNTQKVWFLRTKAGQYYTDFQVNGFVALGWDLIPLEFVNDIKISQEEKKSKIIELYPDEKRPGLILGQMDTFYNKMSSGDLIVIPSTGGKEIAIGELGDLVDEIAHKTLSEPYNTCTFTHKRVVKWLKEVHSWQDIYLFKALRAQQTISDVTEDAKLIRRNLFPVYISDDAVHCTFQKPTNNDLNMVDNINFQSGLLEVLSTTTTLYGSESLTDDIVIKTAVGSPGFFELILPRLPVSVISIALLIPCIAGKVQSTDGKTIASGVSAVITTVNTLLNDRQARKKVSAEIKQIEATANLTNAQAETERANADKIKAETTKILAETQLLKDEHHQNITYEQIKLTASGKTTIQLEEESENLTIASETSTEKAIDAYKKSSDKICTAGERSGLIFNNNKIKRTG